MDITLQTTPQRKFDGGANLVVADVDVAYNELLVAKNCRIKEQRIETAPGFLKYSTEQLDGKVKFIWGDRLNSDYYIVLAAGTKLYTASGGSYTSIKTGLTSTAQIDMDRYSNRLFIGNGVETNMKFDGTDISNHGIDAPGAFTLSEVNPGAGAFANGQVRQFYITFWDSDHSVESNPNATAVSITIAAGPSNIQLTTFPSTTDTNVTDYRVYMTENNGATWYRINELDYATYVGTNYIVSSATNGTTELEFDNDDPAIWGLCEYWKNSLFVVYAGTKTYVNFSKLYRPEQFPLQFRVGIGDASDEEVVALVRFYDYLIIGTNEGLWVLDEHPLNGGVPHRVTGYVGMVNNKAYAILDNQFIFMGTDRRIYSLDPTQFSKEDVRPNYISRKIEPLLKDVTPSALTEASGIFHHVNDRYEMLMSCPVGTASDNNLVFVLNPENGAWSSDDKRISAFARVANSNNEITLYHGDENGYLYYTQDTYYGYGAIISGTSTGSNTSTTFNDTDQADIYNNLATAGGASTLTDSTLTMTTDQYADAQIYIASGTGSGQYRTILSNTATQFTVTVAWSVTPDNTSRYIVGGFLENTLKGLDLIIVDGTGAEQSRIISSHTPTQLTVTSAFNDTPDATSEYTVGGIDYHVETGWDQHTQNQENTKRGWLIHINNASSGNYSIDYGYARDLNYGTTVDYTLSLFNSGYLWEASSSLWGSALWGVVNSFTTVLQFEDGNEYYQRLQHRFRHRIPGEPVKINYVTTSFQDKGIFLVN